MLLVQITSIKHSWQNNPPHSYSSISFHSLNFGSWHFDLFLSTWKVLVWFLYLIEQLRESQDHVTESLARTIPEIPKTLVLQWVNDSWKLKLVEQEFKWLWLFSNMTFFASSNIEGWRTWWGIQLKENNILDGGVMQLNSYQTVSQTGLFSFTKLIACWCFLCHVITIYYWLDQNFQNPFFVTFHIVKWQQIKLIPDITYVIAGVSRGSLRRFFCHCPKGSPVMEVLLSTNTGDSLNKC